MSQRSQKNDEQPTVEASNETKQRSWSVVGLRQFLHIFFDSQGVHAIDVGRFLKSHLGAWRSPKPGTQNSWVLFRTVCQEIATVYRYVTHTHIYIYHILGQSWICVSHLESVITKWTTWPKTWENCIWTSQAVNYFHTIKWVRRSLLSTCSRCGDVSEPNSLCEHQMDGHNQKIVVIWVLVIGHPKVVKPKVSHSVFTPQQFTIERDSTAISDTWIGGYYHT